MRWLKTGLAVLLSVFCLPGCQRGCEMPLIQSLIYTTDAGTILPELQWHEEIVIETGRVSLRRNGRTSDSRVNSGSWTIPLPAETVSDFLTQLSGIDCASFRRQEPQEAPDGGGRESITIVYDDGNRCAMLLDPGVTYSGAQSLVAAVRTFIARLPLPAEAVRYKQMN